MSVALIVDDWLSWRTSSRLRTSMAAAREPRRPGTKAPRGASVSLLPVLSARLMVLNRNGFRVEPPGELEREPSRRGLGAKSDIPLSLAAVTLRFELVRLGASRRAGDGEERSSAVRVRDDVDV